MEDLLLIEIPEFRPGYKRDTRYGYTNRKEKEALKTVLEESTGGYCMYCFSRVRVDGKLYAELEHAIEKTNSEKLIQCVPDIGLACPVCNQTFKRIGERKRRIPKESVERYEKNSPCSAKIRKQCRVPCRALRGLQEDYSSLPDAEIILQPMGVNGMDTKEPLALRYDVLEMKFGPAKDTYSDRERRFINAHINRFRLNDPRYRSRQLFDFVESVIDSNGKIPMYECNNMITEIFRKKLLGRPKEEVLKICESIYIIAFPKM